MTRPTYSDRQTNPQPCRCGRRVTNPSACRVVGPCPLERRPTERGLWAQPDRWEEALSE